MRLFFRMVSAEQAVSSQKVAIEREQEQIKKKYGEQLVNYAKNNSAFAKTLRAFGLDFKHKVRESSDLGASDNSLVLVLKKDLTLARVAFNFHSKAVDELSKSKDIKYKDAGLKAFRERTAFYSGVLRESGKLLSEFQGLRDRQKFVSACLLQDAIAEKRSELLLVQLELERMHMDVFEGTAVMSGRLPEPTEEELTKEEPL
jgi:hypothetical protein